MRKSLSLQKMMDAKTAQNDKDCDKDNRRNWIIWVPKWGTISNTVKVHTEYEQHSKVKYDTFTFWDRKNDIYICTTV